MNSMPLAPTVLSNFLQPVITTWWTCKLVELAAMMLDFVVRLGEITNKRLG
jgi:hypothetical protein